MSNELIKVITTNDGINVIESRDVAEIIGVSHSELLKRIEGTEDGKYKGYIPVLEKGNFTSQNFFIKSTYQGQRREEKCYLLTKQGCEMVANKMTGEKGILFTATYVQAFNEMEKKLQTPATYLEALKALVAAEEEKQALMLENQKQSQIIGELKPKADYTDMILKNPGLITITQIAKDYGMSGTALNKKLHDLHIQYKAGNQWLLYAEYHDKGYTHSETVEIVKKDKTKDVKLNTKWTTKGRLFLYNLLKKNNILPIIERQ